MSFPATRTSKTDKSVFYHFDGVACQSDDHMYTEPPDTLQSKTNPFCN